MVTSNVYFDLPSDQRGCKTSLADYQRNAEALRTSVKSTGLDVTELLGEPSETVGFSVEFKRYEIIVGLLKNTTAQPQRWVVKIDMDDPGWFKPTHQNRLKEMERVEKAVQAALERQLRAGNIVLESALTKSKAR